LRPGTSRRASAGHVLGSRYACASTIVANRRWSGRSHCVLPRVRPLRTGGSRRSGGGHRAGLGWW